MRGESTGALRRDAIGLREVLFQSITAMAPAAAVAASIPAGAAFAGGSLPLAVLVALVACLFTASCVAELARELPAAGSVATYAARGLHPAVGFLVGWGYVFVEMLVPPLLLLQLGFTVAGTLHDEWPSYPADLWWPYSLAGAAVIAVAGYLGVLASARFGTVLGAFEVLVLLVFAALLIGGAGSANTLSVFGTSHTAAGHSGIGGVFAGSVYTVLAFAGFEAAAPLAEETREPRRTMHRAVLGAALGIGLFYVVTTYAMTVYFGPDRFAGFGASGNASWQGVARASFGFFWVLLFLAVVNSTIANANACANVSTRTAFALARIRVLPGMLATLHPRHRSPVAGIAVQTVVAVAAVLGLGLGYGPETAFLLLATVIVTVVIGVYIVVNLACAGHFIRVGGNALKPMRHLLFPVLGIAAFVPALLTAAGLPVFDFVTELTAPVSYAGPIVGVWMAAGVVVLLVLTRRHPERIAETARVHIEEGAPADPRQDGSVVS
ncbi:amino acid permease [Streptomyces sp. SID4946]|uniref:APC family permease n=1 Tax=Streptomyces sp. LamerLS-31b TaxID=1839765 RepID=UPI00081E75B4|nr:MULTISPECIES: APC family permease [unclassified Streptomyces]MYQ96866.1 amino acid permease [Streptomyces sp. SID4946]SCG02462.1 amino acid/polyamine/organocation transporter, APC superfamily [Streptomyces sp. DconLS]SCG03647.1 amino acid/polyamine/organocation transporter, APC superfamily [Streptomyces sp. LamerLS-31b]